MILHAQIKIKFIFFMSKPKNFSFYVQTKIIFFCPNQNLFFIQT